MRPTCSLPCPGGPAYGPLLGSEDSSQSCPLCPAIEVEGGSLHPGRPATEGAARVGGADSSALCRQENPAELRGLQPSHRLLPGHVRPGGAHPGRGPGRVRHLLVLRGPDAEHHLRQLSAGRGHGETAGEAGGPRGHRGHTASCGVAVAAWPVAAAGQQEAEEPGWTLSAAPLGKGRLPGRNTCDSLVPGGWLPSPPAGWAGRTGPSPGGLPAPRRVRKGRPVTPGPVLSTVGPQAHGGCSLDGSDAIRTPEQAGMGGS